MATTNAERQKAYRERAKHQDVARLNTWLDMSAALALARLARHEGISQRAMIERLVVQADAVVCAGLQSETPAWAEYWPVTR